LVASKEVGLEVNPEKVKYMLMSRCQKAGQGQSIKIGNRSFESVAKFKYLGTALHHHHSEHDQGLGLKTSSFEAQGVPGPSILLSVFPYPAIPEFVTGRPGSVCRIYPFVPSAIAFVGLICHMLSHNPQKDEC
jgi:hypothetical protein